MTTTEAAAATAATPELGGSGDASTAYTGSEIHIADSPDGPFLPHAVVGVGEYSDRLLAGFAYSCIRIHVCAGWYWGRLAEDMKLLTSY